MGSHCDPKAKCRVGTMDESQFYAEADAENGAYFRDLLTAWTNAGGITKWGAGGVGLRGVVGNVTGEPKETGICFVAPKFGESRIVLNSLARHGPNISVQQCARGFRKRFAKQPVTV